jgi:hypothetical protein
MPGSLIPARVLRGLRFASRQLPGLRIREDHLQRNRHAEPDHDHPGDLGGPPGQTTSAAGAGPGAHAARVPGTSPDTVRAALAGDDPPRHVRRTTGPAADELELRIWPYRLPAGWRWVTGLDGPALRDAEPQASRPRRRRIPDPREVPHRVHDIVAGIWHVKRIVPVRGHLTYPQAERKAHSPGPPS